MHRVVRALNPIEFDGRYKLQSSENLTEFLESVGVAPERMELIQQSWPEFEITKRNNVHAYTLQWISAYHNSTVLFTPDEEFDAVRFFDNISVKSDISFVGNSWVQTLYGDKDVTVEWEFGRKGLVKVSYTHYRNPASGECGAVFKVSQMYKKVR